MLYKFQGHQPKAPADRRRHHARDASHQGYLRQGCRHRSGRHRRAGPGPGDLHRSEAAHHQRIHQRSAVQ